MIVKTGVEMKNIKGKTALVTGASSGIGKETVKRLLSQGAYVYAAARRTEKMKDLETMGAVIVKMDVTEDESMTASVQKILEERKSIDILVNNAGYGFFGSLEDVPMDEARRQFDVNIFGLARLTQLVLPAMRENRYGKIVNISSMAGKIYAAFGSWYYATKHALEALTDCLRLEVKSFGIDAIIIEPGGIATEWGDIAAENLIKTSGSGAYEKKAQENSRKMKAIYSSNRLSEPDVIAKVIEKAVTSKRPRIRYAAGYGARISIFLRHNFPDRWFDKLSLSLL